MKRGIAVLAFCTLAIVLYFTASKWAIHHVALTSDDILRDGRPVTLPRLARRPQQPDGRCLLPHFQSLALPPALP